MRSDRHVVIFCPGFARDESDDYTVPTLQVLLKELLKQCSPEQFSIISFQYPFHDKAYTWNGIWVYPAGGKMRKGFWRFFTWWKVLQRFKKIRAKHADLILHSIWLTECYAIGSWLSKRHSLPLIATVMGQDAKKSNLYLRWLRGVKSEVICCSDYAAKVLQNAHGIKCKEIIPFGVQATEFEIHQGKNRNIDILGVGNLGPVKRYNVFVRTVYEIKKIVPDVYCEIVGDGEHRRELEKLVIDLGLSKNLVLVGYMAREAVIKKMGQAKLLLHTSEYEGQGYVFLEALAAGAYVVSLNRGFLPDSEKVKRLENDRELAGACVSTLKGPMNFESFVPVPIEETAKKYLSYYF